MGFFYALFLFYSVTASISSIFLIFTTSLSFIICIISMLEQKDVIEDSLLKQISAVLKIPVEAFQNFDEEQAINIISNTFHEGAVAVGNNSGHVNTTVNPIDKIVQLHEEKIALYERMLKEKDEMMIRLEKLS